RVADPAPRELLPQRLFPAQDAFPIECAVDGDRRAFDSQHALSDERSDQIARTVARTIVNEIPLHALRDKVLDDGYDNVRLVVRGHDRDDRQRWCHGNDHDAPAPLTRLAAPPPAATSV